jgi:hypothetical protein
MAAVYRYICSILTLDDLLEVQTALMILKRFGMSDIFIEQEVNAELERRTV